MREYRIFMVHIPGSIFTLLFLLLAVAPGAVHGADRAPGTADFVAIDAYITAQMQEQRIPGLALGIVRGNQIVHLKGFGRADDSGRPVTPQTPFGLASVSKSLTALSVMQLVERGKLDLDAPIQRYLPWFRVTDPDATSRITARHLLHHTSGLPESADVALLTDSDTSEGTLERHVRALHDIQLNRPVGTTFEYANVNYLTLGLLVQTVSGQPYERYVQQNIFAPLEMQHSFTSQAQAQPDGLAIGSRYWFGVPISANVPDNRAEQPSGRLISSAEDMTHYLIAQLNGGQYASRSLLSPAGIATLHQPGVKLGDGEAGYGMGWFAGERNGVHIVEHSGDGINFHANVVLIPDYHLGIVLLENAQNALKPALMSGIARGVASLLLGKQPTTPESGSLYLMLYYTLLALVVIQVIGIIRSILHIRHWRAHPDERPSGERALGRHVVVPLILNLAYAFVLLVGLPTLFKTSLAYLCLYVPDFGYTLIVSGALAVFYAGIRTPMVWQLVRDRSASGTVPVLT